MWLNWSQIAVYETSLPWYSAEGSGEGWFYSVLGGGQDLRPTPQSQSSRVPLDYDNTDSARMRGDSTIPTVFNGNFDQVNNTDTLSRIPSVLGNDALSIPGWSLHNDSSIAPVNYLENFGTINNPNYALRLGNGLNEVTHNRFVVPDWGALRFDLHVLETQLDSGGKVVLTWQDAKGNNVGSAFEIFLETAPTTVGATQNSYEAAFFRIGYGTEGFETFTANVPNELRGKVATLKFEVEGGSYVYLDNVFLKSQHLLFGNPTEARTTGNPVSNQYYNNYLIEKPQYAVSYSGDSNIPNWSSWQINETWLGTGRPSSDFFFRDPDLNSLGLISAKNTDYDRPLANIVPGDPSVPTPINPDDGLAYKLAPGHLTANADRNRHLKDSIATYSTINIVPQHAKHNAPLWLGLEDFTRKVVTEQEREVYVIAGAVGEKDPNTDKANINVLAKTSDPAYPAYAVQVPSHLWKVLLILEDPGMGIQDIILDNATAFAVYTENILPAPGSAPFTRWNNGGMQIMTVAALEMILNNDPNNQARNIRYSFFSELPNNIRTALKNNPVTVPSGTTPHTAFLLADTEASFFNSSIISADASVGHDGIEEDTILYPSSVQFSSCQIGSSQVGPTTRKPIIGGNRSNFVHIPSHNHNHNHDYGG